ncbi:hypothetical protein ACX3O0_04960 [Homoserinimonas sp. A447]
MDELTLLRSIGSDIEGPSDSATQRTRDLLAKAAASEVAPKQRMPRRRIRHRGRVLWGAGIPLAAALTVALVAVNLSGGVTVPGFPEVTLPMDSASAAEVLLETASLSEAAADPVVGPGSFLKVTTTTEQVFTNVFRGAVDIDRTATWGWLERTESELYIPANRADEWVWVMDTTPEALGGQVLQSWGEGAAEGRQERMSFIYGAYPGEDLVLRFRDGFLKTKNLYRGTWSPRLHLADSMPSDPNDLMAWYRQQAQDEEWMRGDDGSAFDLMAIDLRWNLFPAAQRGQIWRAMASIPGIVISDEGTTEDGHPTVTIGLPDATVATADDAIDEPEAASLREITIDTVTGTLLSQRVFAPSPVKADGTALYPSTIPWRSSTFTAEVVSEAP